MDKKRILVVEDEAVTSLSLNLNLVELGYEVAAIVTSGEDAIRAAAELQPDLVLMDITLDGPMDGIEAAAAIRKLHAIPTIYLTAHANAETVERAKTTEPFGYLPKPCSMDALMSAIEVALYKGDADAARRKAEQALQASEELIKSILEIVDEGFIVIDRDFRILSANKAFATMVKQPVEEILGRYCYEVSHHVSAPCYTTGHECAVQKVFETRKPGSCIHLHHDARGGPLHIETKAYPLRTDSAGNVVTAIETLMDTTEKHKLVDQLHQAQKMESIGTLAGGIAHDFNNILTAIIGYGNLALMKMAKDDPQRLYIDYMLEAGGRAAHLTKDLLLFSRKQISERTPVNLNEIILKVEKFLKRVIGEDVECRTILRPGALPIYGDAHQLEQVLMNLATNARDAMSTGGTFTITTEQVTFSEEFISVHGYGMPGNYALTSISDTGKGMDAVTREHIFEPFFTTKEVGKGTGLGLAVVYGIIKQHQGFVNVYSEPGQGSTFKIYLPLITGDVATEQKPVEERPTGGTETILLAEDDEAVRDLTKTVLVSFGYNVITANDGQDALEKYKVNKNVIQLLLFDIIMPKKTGKEAYDEIKAIRPDIRILFQSGYAPDVIRQKALIEEKMPVIFKPVSPTSLLKQVREALDNSNS